ncbi:hypothetical protein JCGZ_13252 [Jatropha curcas]|uniref:Bifunctional inhibitor/plant lipid transfer protein/seed storage helical domain-containing protein n=2 Tax=Jatropha curcas TaxID=180498 RepID=A0A067K8A4_JATCU|nr:hypothetical protein JCGZ_13252 [Jatropha curcas]
MASEKKIGIFCIAVASLVMVSVGSLQQDEQDCADQLTNLASCIPFVSGTAKKPTPECCQDTQKLKSTKPKCLCVLIKESSDPSVGLPVNTTLALQMPSVCNIDAKVSDCPTILNLPPDSPDAKIFKEAAGISDSTTTSSKDSPPASSGSSASTSTSSSSETSTTSSSDSKATPSNNNGPKANQVFWGGIIMSFSAWIFFY